MRFEILLPASAIVVMVSFSIFFGLSSVLWYDALYWAIVGGNVVILFHNIMVFRQLNRPKWREEFNDWISDEEYAKIYKTKIDNMP